MEQRLGQGGGKGKPEDLVESAVGLDQERPFLELLVAGRERRLEREEGWIVAVVGWEGELGG